MRRSDPDEWNLTVSDFVARLLISAKSKDDLDLFLNSQPDGVIKYDVDKKVYVITLPGHP